MTARRAAPATAGSRPTRTAARKFVAATVPQRAGGDGRVRYERVCIDSGRGWARYAWRAAS